MVVLWIRLKPCHKHYAGRFILIQPTSIALRFEKSTSLLIICDTRLHITQILPSFTMLYAQVLKRPSLLSARSDAELLFVTAQVIDHYLSDTPEKKTISGITQAMATAALNRVNGPRISPRGGQNLNIVPNPPSSSRNEQASPISPASSQGNTQASFDTPLRFYFNVTPDRQIHAPSASDTEAHPANVKQHQQPVHEPPLPAKDNLARPMAMEIPVDQSPTGSRLWLPPY